MDFGQFNLDKVPLKEVKSQEVIKRHSVDPGMNADPLSKAMQIFTSGDELQKFSVLNSFPELFNLNTTECLKTLVPKMQEGLQNSSAEYHYLASQAIKTLLIDKIITPDVFVSSFLRHVLAAMDNRDPAIATTWVEMLYETTDLLPTRVLQSDVLSAILLRCDNARPVSSRVTGCKLLKKVVKHCDASMIKKDILPRVISLSLDINEEVRAAVCLTIDSVALRAGPEILKTHLMNCLVDLANDDSAQVKEAAFITFVNILPLMPLEMVKSTGVHLVTKFVTYAFRVDENLLVTIAENFDSMCSGVEQVLQPTDKENYINWFLSLASLGTPQYRRERKIVLNTFEGKSSADKLVLCRQNCATNFPFMVKFCKTDQDKKFSDLLKECYHELRADSSSMVRRRTCLIFTEVMKLYGRGCSFMRDDLIYLLGDQSEEVLESLIPQLQAIVEEFISMGVLSNLSKDTVVLDMVSALMKCETTLSQSHNWRLYTAFLMAIDDIIRNYQTETMCANYLPLMWKRLFSVRSLPSRIAVVRTIACIMRYTKKSQTRNDIKNKIINELSMSPSFYNRLLFIKCCPVFCELFSCKFFKENFFYNVALLADDPVSNMRLAFVKFLPDLKGMLTPDDKNLLQQLVQTISKLESDPDRDVKMELAAVKPVFDRVDRDKMYPEEKKKFDAEMMFFNDGGRAGGASAGPRPSGAVPPAPAAVPRPTTGGGPTRNVRPAAPPTGPVTPLRNTVPQQPPGTVNAPRKTVPASGTVRMVELNDKEFMIDAGVKLSSTGGAAGAPRRSVPIRRGGGTANKGKRHSVEASSLLDKANNNQVVRRSQPSHLPRPLSCLGLPAKPQPKPSSIASKLPVSRFSDRTIKR